MALSRDLSVHTYRSSSGGQTYSFDIVVDLLGKKSVRNIRSPRGLITDSMTNVPQVVVDDINAALDIVTVQMTEAVVSTGSVIFDGDTSRPVSGLSMTTTNYRVVVTSPDGTPMVVENKTTSGFDIVAPSTYGSVEDPLDVDWVVLVATAPSASLSGTVSFGPSDSSLKTITFPSALSTTSYRVVLTPNGFFPAQVQNKTRSGFTLNIGIGLAVGQTVSVGYDVFM